ncbi:MAG: aldehyde dehydrogenase [Parvibaculaceae bacterium]
MSLTFDPAEIAVPSGHHIGGEFVHLGPDDIEVLRPSDHQPFGAIADGGETAVDFAVAAARKALKESRWARVAPRERARVLRRWADLVDEAREDLARLEAAGSSRLISLTATGDVVRAAEVIRFYAEYCDKLEGQVTATEEGSLSLVRNEPYGIVGAIVPWNFPMITAAWKFAPALAAGNAMVMKTSELTPHSLLALAGLAGKAGLPAGLFNVVNGLGPTTGGAIVRHPDIRKVSFTGSSGTGLAIIREARIKPLTLELGGKSPQLVFADAGDLDTVSARVAAAFMANAGQVCTAGSRLIVQNAIADELLARVERRCKAVRPGPTWDARTDFAPIISRRQADRIDALVRQTVKEGAAIRFGGNFLESRNAGAFYAPTMLEGVSEEMTGFREEFFGPVVSVHRFDDIEEGVALADHPSFGLAASVHTTDIRKALHAADRIEAGTVWVNHHGRAPEFTSPAGGFKSSGYGKDMGRAGMEAYLRKKAVWVNYVQ